MSGFMTNCGLTNDDTSKNAHIADVEFDTALCLERNEECKTQKGIIKELK